MNNVGTQKVMKKMEADEAHKNYKASDFWETLVGLAIAWSCVAAFSGGCVYVCNYFRDHKKNTTKQEQVSVSLVKSKQIELQR